MQQFKDAARNAWNAISHADTCGIVELQWQSMALFLGLSAQEMGEDVMSMSKTIQDVDEIFNRCLELRPTLDGPDRPDLRGLLLAATALDRVEELDWIEVESIDDPLLASGFFTDHLVLDQFIVPESLLATLKGDLSPGSYLIDGQRFLVPGNGKCIGRIVSGQDTPECVGVGIGIKLAGQLMNGSDKLLCHLPRLGNEASEGRKLFPERL